MWPIFVVVPAWYLDVFSFCGWIVFYVYTHNGDVSPQSYRYRSRFHPEVHKFEEKIVQLQCQHIFQPAMPEEKTNPSLRQDKNPQHLPSVQIHPAQSNQYENSRWNEVPICQSTPELPNLPLTPALGRYMGQHLALLLNVNFKGRPRSDTST